MPGFIAPILMFIIIIGFAGYMIFGTANQRNLHLKAIVESMVKSKTSTVQSKIDNALKPSAESRQDRLKTLTPTEQQAELTKNLQSNLIALDKSTRSIIAQNKKIKKDTALNQGIANQDNLLDKLLKNNDLQEEKTIHRLIQDSQDIINELNTIHKSAQNVDNKNATYNQSNHAKHKSEVPTNRCP